MSWYNPLSWGATPDEKKALTLDQMVARMVAAQRTAANISVTPESALRAPTVFAIVNVLSRAVASLPLHLQRDRSEAGRRQIEKLPDHNVQQLLGRRPNTWQTAYDYWALVMLRLTLYGGFYALKQQAANGRIVNLVPLNNSQVKVELTNSGALMFDIVTPQGQSLRVPQSQMHWILKQTADGITPLSPVENVRESIALEIAAEEFGAATFGGAAIPNVVITRQGSFADEEAQKRFARSWRDAFQKKRGTAVLEEGFDVKQLQLTNEESQFLETRKYQRTVIAGAWGVPPHMVGDLERATFSNIEHMSLNFVIHALRPYLECIEASVGRDLLTDKEVKSGVGAKFDTEAMLRGDTKSRAESFQIKRQWGVINANEWRAAEGLDARDDEAADDYLVPMNYTFDDKLPADPEEPEPPLFDDPDDEQEVEGMTRIRRVR